MSKIWRETHNEHSLDHTCLLLGVYKGSQALSYLEQVAGIGREGFLEHLAKEVNRYLEQY